MGITTGIVEVEALGSVEIKVPGGGFLIWGQAYVGGCLFSLNAQGCEFIAGYPFDITVTLSSTYKVIIKRNSGADKQTYRYFIISTKHT